MNYRNLGKSGLKVSEVGLGCNNFGWRIDESTSVNIVNRALDIGITFFDTADAYGETRSEQFLGKALKGKRSQVMIATKFGSPVGKGPNDGGGSRYHILKAVDASLKRLDTDYIDLYQMHKADPTTPLEETLRTLNDLVHAGKIRYFGCSNYAAWRINEALWTSQANNLGSFITVQTEYSLLYRTIEQEIVPCCQAHGIGVIPWGPLAAGFLTGKYHRGESAPPGSRLSEVKDLKPILNETNYEVIEKLAAFAAQCGYSPNELAIAWLLSHSWISTVIAGATRPEQLDANFLGTEWKLSPTEVAEVDSISEVCKYQRGIRPIV